MLIAMTGSTPRLSEYTHTCSGTHTLQLHLLYLYLSNRAFTPLPPIPAYISGFILVSLFSYLQFLSLTVEKPGFH